MDSGLIAFSLLILIGITTKIALKRIAKNEHFCHMNAKTTAAAYDDCDGYNSKSKRFRAHVLWRKMLSVPSYVLFDKKFFDLRAE